MSWVGVPQPCDGRCWNCPTESWSPPGVLVSADSCMAVATAMTQPRGGRWSCWPTATMMAALSTCALVHRPMGGHPPAGGAGGLPGAAPVRLGAGLVQAARATPPAPRRASPTQHMTMTSTTPVRAATALALTVEPERHPNDESDLGVHRLDEGVGQAVFDGGDDRVVVAHDALSQLDEGRQSAAAGPADPPVQCFDRFGRAALGCAPCSPSPDAARPTRSKHWTGGSAGPAAADCLPSSSWLSASCATTTRSSPPSNTACPTPSSNR